MGDVSTHYDGSASTYHEQYDPDLLWTNDEYPANLFRLRKVIEILKQRGATSVYEVGAAEASTLVRIHHELGIEVRGSDLAPEMVRLGKDNLSNNGLDPHLLERINLEDFDAVEAEAQRIGQSDAVLALGVIPHISDDQAFVRALSLFVKPGGTLILQFRNLMFSMFTFNRLTRDFVVDELMAPVPGEFQRAVAEDLDGRLAVDKPPVRRRDDGHGYDEILSRFHNPFELADVVRSCGYEDLFYRWYNFHPTYPMLADAFDAQDYRRAQVALEDDTSWRGMFLCSAGMIVATKQ